MAQMVRGLGIRVAPHGFHSSFRDWAVEGTDAPREVCELVLAHVNTNHIEAAYRRTDLFERRRDLVEQFAAFLSATEDQVAPGRWTSSVVLCHAGSRNEAAYAPQQGNKENSSVAVWYHTIVAFQLRSVFAI